MVEASLKKLAGGAVSAVFSILIVGAAPASAETINFLNVGNASTVRVGGTGIAARTVQAGELNWNWITPSGGNGTSFYTYCMDVLNYLTDPQVVNVLSTESVPDTSAVADRGAKAAWLFNQYSEGIRSESNEAVADRKAAALQVAIWEVLYDATPNLASGVFQGLSDFGGGVFTQAGSYLSALFQGQTIGSSSFNSALYFTSTAVWLDSIPQNGVPGQDQITRVPEPGTLLLMGLGGVALFRNRRRQARS
jgi:hypothetical protein